MFYEDELFDFFNNFNNMEKTLFNNAEIIRKNSPNEFLKVYLGLTTPLGPRSINVLVYMIRNVNGEGIYEGNYEDLMSKFNISRATLAGIMTELQENGLIEKSKNGWKISEDVKMRSNGNSLIIKFDNKNVNANDYKKYLKEENNNLKKELNKIKEPQAIGRINRLVPKFNFEKFEGFVDAYYDSYVQLSIKDDNLLDEDSLRKYYLLLRDEYKKDNKGLDFLNYVSKFEHENKEEKEFVMNSIQIYLRKYDKIDCDRFIADFEDVNFGETKDRYLRVISSNTELSQDTKFLMKSMMMHILNIAKVFGFYDFATIYHLINNDHDKGRKIMMEAELVARNLRTLPVNFAVSLNAYHSYINKQDHIFSCLSALSNMVLDDVQIIKYTKNI